MRKIIFLILLLLCLAHPSHATMTFVVGHSCNASNGSNGSTVQCAISSQTAGNQTNMFIGWCDDASCNTTSPASDTVAVTGGGTDTCPSGTRTNATAAPFLFASIICFNYNIVGGGNTYTVTITSSNTIYYLTVLGNEWTGQQTSSTSLDQVGEANNTVGTSPASVTTTGSTTKQNETIYAGCFISGGPTVTAGAGYTLVSVTSSGVGGGYDESMAITSTGSQTATMTYSGTHRNVCSIATFIAASQPAGGSTRHRAIVTQQ